MQDIPRVIFSPAIATSSHHQLKDLLLGIGQDKDQSNFWRKGALLDRLVEGLFGKYEVK